ncbi:MAG TPA: hypothetical protein VHQ64_15375 [Pyrinomonadaceae bacterium]|nr:hypothetical protein [Pyrinomonadaceae bacterium]
MRGTEYLERFFNDLVETVAQYAGVDLEVERIGTIDKQVRQGADWDKFLSDPLSTDRAFIAIMTPTYFNRENCGKELFGFLLRSKNIGIDTNEALTEVENVLPIRWMDERAYYSNVKKESTIPRILRRINDTPDDPGGDEERTEAIKRYRKKGMSACVTVEPHYTELLQLFALRIRDLVTLPPARGISFSTLSNAFDYDWKTHFASQRPIVAPQPAPAETVMPRPLDSVVAFYLTNRHFEIDRSQVDFADQLIAEAHTDEKAATDPALGSVIADIRSAALTEKLTVFHAAANLTAPGDTEGLIARLSKLSQKRILTALVIDSNIWPNAPAPTLAAGLIEDTIRAASWTGPALIFSEHESAINVETLVRDHNLPSRLVVLPNAPDARIAILRQVFVDTRGRLLTMSTATAPGAEGLPILTGVRGEG